jgi:hypothetical protein
MTPEQIKAYPIDPRPAPDADRHAIVRARLESVAQWSPRQQLGNRMAIGCVALEITQRCNLDCTCCYLSEHSEAVRDLPLEEIFRRIEMIKDYYGPGTAVQVTGGDPTLRKFPELLEIVRRVRGAGMRPSLFTNGIKTSASYLSKLHEAGLADVAFHVDLTQERKGYETEVELNEIRERYVGYAREAGVTAFFNYTVTQRNFHEIPDMVRFYTKHADVVKTASFQLQADTGRGIDRERDDVISQASVIRSIERGAGTSINFDASPVGHTSCNKYAMCFEANGHLYNALDDSEFVARIVSSRDAEWDRYTSGTPFQALTRWLRDRPGDVMPASRYALGLAWRAKRDLVKARGRIHRLSFFVHNFMDACHLEPDRIKACSFYTITRDGPVSMCLANAKRDEFILQPIQIMTPEEAAAAARPRYWEPLTGEVRDEVGDVDAAIDPTEHPISRLKGRSRQQVAERRNEDRATQQSARERAQLAGGNR